MKNVYNFLQIHYDGAIELKEKFKITEKREWNTIITLLELNVQIGHLFNINNHNEIFDELNRNISNMGDEISDVLLQLCYLFHLEKVNLEKVLKYSFDLSDVSVLPILCGQVIEAVMEKEEYRFRKGREGFETIDEFIEDRLLKIMVIVYNYAEKNNCDMINEFEIMKKDANRFLKNYVSNKI